METNVIIGLVAIAAMVVGGLVITRLLARAVYPIREQLFTEASELLRTGNLSSRERGVVNLYLDLALSFAAGWMVLLAVCLAIWDTVRRVPLPCPTKRKIPATLTGKFALSALAANPVALVLAVPLVALQTVLAGLIERETPRAAVRDVAAHMPIASRILAA